MKPINQASFMSLVVPVLPATGRPTARARWPVPLVTTLSIRLVMMYDISGDTAGTGVRGEPAGGGGVTRDSGTEGSADAGAGGPSSTGDVTLVKTGMVGVGISSRTLPSRSVTLVMK